MPDKKNIDEPLEVSVIIPAYNAGEFLARALDSVIAQTRSADEIIVVDDGSADDTGMVAKGYGAQVKYIYQENAGASAARNAGIKAAQHEWIAFLDGDDEWLPEKLQLQMALLQRNPLLDWTTGNFYRCLCRENRRGPDISPDKAARLLQDKDYLDNYFTGYTKGLGGWTGTMLIKKKVLEEAGLFCVEQRVTEDLDLWFRIAYRHPRIGYLAEPLSVYYVDTPGSLVKTQKDPKYIRMLLERHFKLARAYGCLEEFYPCAALILGHWLKVLLQADRGAQVRSLLCQYGWLFSGYCRLTTYISALFPRTARLYRRIRLWLGKVTRRKRNRYPSSGEGFD